MVEKRCARWWWTDWSWKAFSLQQSGSRPGIGTIALGLQRHQEGILWFSLIIGHFVKCSTNCISYFPLHAPDFNAVGIWGESHHTASACLPRDTAAHTCAYACTHAKRVRLRKRGERGAGDLHTLGSEEEESWHASLRASCTSPPLTSPAASVAAAMWQLVSNTCTCPSLPGGPQWAAAQRLPSPMGAFYPDSKIMSFYWHVG